MKRNSRVRPFPRERLQSFDAAELRLVERSGQRDWLPALRGVVSGLARGFGLGAAALNARRVQVIKVEDLREVFPGRWVFAVLADPLAERKGFLALDPVLCGRVFSRLQIDRVGGRGWSGLAEGTVGALGWVIASALEDLCRGEHGDDWAGWRFLGICESAGEIGRANLSEAALVGTWISVAAGWDQGFAVWLEPESSILRRPESGPEDEELKGVDRVSVPLSLRVGSSSLRFDEFLGLGAGDVLLLEDESEQDLILRAGPLSITGIREGSRFKVTGIRLQDGGEIMAATEMQCQGEGEGEGLDAGELGKLPVEITAEAGRMFLSVGQLSRLRVGQVLALPVDVLGPLDLRAGGRLLARGELVEVEGQRGIRLIEMALGAGESDEDPA